MRLAVWLGLETSLVNSTLRGPLVNDAAELGPVPEDSRVRLAVLSPREVGAVKPLYNEETDCARALLTASTLTADALRVARLISAMDDTSESITGTDPPIWMQGVIGGSTPEMDAAMVETGEDGSGIDFVDN